MGERKSFQEIVLEQLDIQMQKNKAGPPNSYKQKLSPSMLSCRKELTQQAKNAILGKACLEDRPLASIWRPGCG